MNRFFFSFWEGFQLLLLGHVLWWDASLSFLCVRVAMHFLSWFVAVCSVFESPPHGAAEC